MTLDALNKLFTLANQMGWKTIVVGENQFEDGKNMTYIGAPLNYSMWDSVAYNKFELKIVEGNYLGIEP